MNLIPEQIARFWARVDQRGGPAACWPWTRMHCPRRGHGLLHWHGKQVPAHRLAYELAVGPVPPGRNVKHTCATVDCCNPAHLTVVDVAARRAAVLARRAARRVQGFWARVDRRSAAECWPWQGGKKAGGYGHVRWDGGRCEGAHRIAYQLTCGPIPPGLHVLHTCDNPPCCNPAHLWLGTHTENMRDRDRKGRGHHIEASARARRRFTPAQVQAIRALHRAGTSSNAIARRYRCNAGTIWAICQGRTYADVPDTLAA